mmetsp:Transcript_63729/g.116233  ORF Transcript_63729/g.116233 Transcript_63729/m.116233 type:complete len:480 (+) Transcript_63729:57-1496(+)
MADAKPFGRDVEDYGSVVDSNGSGLKHLELRGNSVALTGAIIIADVVGAGILSMPNAFASFGWVLGSILTCVLLAMNVHISILMWRIYMKFPQARTYMDMADAALGRLPDNERITWVNMVGIVQYSFILAMLCLYALSLGKGVAMLFYKVFFCLPSWTAIGCAAIIPFFATSRTLGTWKSLMFINVLTIVGSVIIPLVVMFFEGLEKTRSKDAVFVAATPPSFSGWFSGLSTMTFAFTSQFMITEICAEMKDYTEFPRAYINFSMPFQVSAYLIVGLGGYYYIGDSVTGMVMDNIPFSPVYQLAAACLIVHMIITYFLKAVVLGRAVHKRVDGKEMDDDTSHAWTTWTGIVVLIVSVSYVVANILPFFEDFVELLGSFLTPTGCYIIPIVMYWRILRDYCTEEEQPSAAEKAIIVIEMIFSIVMTFIGTFVAVREIYYKWDNYGGPFECHCHNLWNTCECSAFHPGMEFCLNTETPDFF